MGKSGSAGMLLAVDDDHLALDIFIFNGLMPDSIPTSPPLSVDMGVPIAWLTADVMINLGHLAVPLFSTLVIDRLSDDERQTVIGDKDGNVRKHAIVLVEGRDRGYVLDASLFCVGTRLGPSIPATIAVPFRARSESTWKDDQNILIARCLDAARGTDIQYYLLSESKPMTRQDVDPMIVEAWQNLARYIVDRVRAERPKLVQDIRKRGRDAVMGDSMPGPDLMISAWRQQPS